MDMSKRTFICVLLLCYIHGCLPVLIRARGNTRTAMVRLKSVPTRKVNDFTTFRKTMAKKMRIDEALLTSKVARQVFNKNGKYINLKDRRHRGRLTTILLSAMCSACGRNCACRRRLGCSQAC